ncbi:GrpE-domain-containing protein [Xylaria bambusicola]|uniref:GrpE-domain-containing protein n=1 Tax=Xylaria bambusicola TaxID=326684 RepID=UPI002008CB9E|nr:GrpE-domain-containing protein [Xylaria bambusicola]KAI0518411.1 GrpE-domain-containing protein [Xylaria bambusicola]
MFRRAFIASSRAASSSSKIIAQHPSVRSQFPSAPLNPLKASLSARTRWYSDQADATTKKDGEEAVPEAEPKKSEDAESPSSVEAELKKKLETKEREAIDWKDKYLRSVADFRNLQDRTQREVKAARDFAIQRFAKDLVESIDNLDRALSMGQEKMKVEEDKEANVDLNNFYEGVKMTETSMLQTLSKHGLDRFNPEGEKFNPNEHEATFMTPMPDKEENTVFHVQQKGYKLNGRILRAAKVGVVKNQ